MRRPPVPAGLVTIVAVVLLAGCAQDRPRPATTGQAQQIAQFAEEHGDGYRRADDPDAIVKLVEYYAAQSGGTPYATQVSHGTDPGGHVDVAFPLPSTVDGTGAGTECWRFSWRQRRPDPYIRAIDYDPVACPPGVTASPPRGRW
jgi:hypothetical protein